MPTSVRLPPDVKTRIERLAVTQHRSISQQIRYLIDLGLQVLDQSAGESADSSSDSQRGPVPLSDPSTRATSAR